MTQIPSELIDRLRKCCEWLSENRRDKFLVPETEEHRLIFLEGDYDLIDFNNLDNPILSDPLCEYPNALHRIVKEATGKEMWMDLYPDVNDNFIYETETLKAKFPLHAEIEATCMAIEERMKK